MLPFPGEGHAAGIRKCLAGAFTLIALLPCASAAAQRTAPPLAERIMRDAPLARGGVLLRTDVLKHEKRVRIPRSFLGLSAEYPDVIPATGSQATTHGSDPVFAQLVNNLNQGSGALMLRIGGGTADSAWWNPNGATPPNGITLNITPIFTSGLHDFLALTGQPLILDLNMAANQPSIATDWAAAALAAFGPSIRAFEVGNEPDLYRQRAFGSGFARPPGWGFPDYLREFTEFSRRLAAVGAKKLAGPAASGKRSWEVGLAKLLRKEGRRLSLVTYHHYAYCQSGSNSIGRLLSKKVIGAALARFAPTVATAHRFHRRLRVTETGPNACGSDPSFAAGVWIPDWLFALAVSGVAGADIHQIGSSPFVIRYAQGRFYGGVSPLYYGMLMFEQATANGADLLIGPTARQQLQRGANARVWTTLDHARNLRVLAVNKSASRGGPVVIKIDGGRRPGELTRLLGPSLDATTGATLAGQSVPYPSTTGLLEGQRVAESVQSRRGVYRFELPPASAALLVVPGVRSR